MIELCGVAFLIGAMGTGLLDGKRTATHWKWAARSSDRLPAPVYGRKRELSSGPPAAPILGENGKDQLQYLKTETS